MGGGKGVKLLRVVYAVKPGQPILKVSGKCKSKIMEKHGLQQTYYGINVKRTLKRVFSKIPFSVYTNFTVC